jgi:hypothetical protein
VFDEFVCDFAAISIPSSGYDVNNLLNRSLFGASMLALLALAGCGTPSAKDFGGSWKPVNRFQDATTEIPLAQPYTYYAAPMDGTLKTMLARWSKDSGRELSYQLHSDFTLYKPVTQIHTLDIQAAMAELNQIYAAQQVSVTANDKQIVVAEASAVTPEATMTKEAANPSKTDAPATAK